MSHRRGYLYPLYSSLACFLKASLSHLHEGNGFFCKEKRFINFRIKNNPFRKNNLRKGSRLSLVVGVQGFEPRKCLSQSQVPYRLATPQYSAAVPTLYTAYARQPFFDDGWDRWIRTIEMTESKSVALPLGYIPLNRI